MTSDTNRKLNSSQKSKHRKSKQIDSPEVKAWLRTVGISSTTTMKPRVRQWFKKQPQEVVAAWEGNSVILECEIANQQGAVQWTKDGELIFWGNGKKIVEKSYTNYFLIGEVEKGDHTLEVRSASEKDSGTYICQAPPLEDTGITEDYLRASSNVTVLKRPPPQEVTSSHQDPSNNSGSSLINHHQQQLSLSGEGGNEALDDSSSGSKSGNGGSQLQARDIPSSTKLSAGFNLVNGQAPLSPHSGFITPHASTALHSASSSSSSPVHIKSLNLIIVWPYLLLCAAVLLMLANIYLIYSLVKRHKRQKEGFSQQTDNSLESGSNGGCSATGSAGTGSSRLGANELSGCELEHSVELPVEMKNTFCNKLQQQQQPQQQQQINSMPPPTSSSISSSLTPLPLTLPLHQHLHHQQQDLQQQQYQIRNHQAWNGHEFLTIDSNGWVLEI